MRTTATLELTQKGNINDKTILERDREVRDFNVTLYTSAITRRRHLVIDTHRTDLGVMRKGYHHIHEMSVTMHRTCVLSASEDMLTQRINAHLARAKCATVSVGKHLEDGAIENKSSSVKTKGSVQKENLNFCTLRSMSRSALRIFFISATHDKALDRQAIMKISSQIPTTLQSRCRSQTLPIDG